MQAQKTGMAPPPGYTLKQEAGAKRYQVKPEERINVSAYSHPCLRNGVQC